MPSNLSDLPVELLLDNVLDTMPINTVLTLGSTNKFFAALANDDMFWKRRLQSDFNFADDATARISGYKFIYRGLTAPKTFVWGEGSMSRLGLPKIPASSLRAMGVPFPAQIRIPGRRIVNLVPGGMSFHALDSEGDVFVWGTLDGTSMALSSDGFSESAKQAPEPHRLILPTPIRSISCGRLHTTMLSSTGEIYNFLSWGRPYRLVSDALDRAVAGPSAPDAPVQIENGWGFSAALTHSGAVYVWWPFEGALKRAYDEETERMERRVTEDGEDNLKARATAAHEIPCHVWDLDVQPRRLPNLPYDLPQLSPTLTGEDDESLSRDAETRIIKIAGMDNNLIALTNRGHVLILHGVSETEISRSEWKYLPDFCDVERVREHPTFKKERGDSEYIEPPQTMQITHISAHFTTFVAYSTGASSIVLIGKDEVNADTEPRIIPQLQNRSVISVVIGDYHNGALTADGQLLTWGAYSKGALGLGDPADLDVGAPGGFASTRQRDSARVNGPRATPPEVLVPTPVRFDWGKKSRQSFCFLAAAAGWHMGALVIDLEPEPEDDPTESHVNMPGSYQPVYRGPVPEVEENPSLPTVPPFMGRGRGRGFGGGMRRGLLQPQPFWMGHAAGRGEGGPPPPGGDEA